LAALVALALFATVPGAAEPQSARLADEWTQELTAVTVQAAPSVDDALRATARTVIDEEQLQRFQPNSIFDAVQGVPGVSVNGGPRSSGMKFNIRGYSDSEDVLIKVDGATKGFEKYRFGGVFLEPDLLEQVEITRGPSLLEGSGALGGTVSARTRDAADLLLPGRRFGARARAAYNSNNNETLGSLTLFGRPSARVDLLGSVVRRSSNDITLPDGSALQYSAIDTRSALIKGTVAATDSAAFSASFVSLDDTGPQAFDATAGQPGVFGTVQRTVDDRTLTFNAAYEPGNPWLALRGVFGYSNTYVDDLHLPGQSIFANSFTGQVNDEYRYDIWSYELSNRSRFATGAVRHELTLAAQGVDNTREVTRVTQNQLINNILYPGGFNPAQPPGIKRSLGLVLQDTAAYGDFTLTPGVRFDQYDITAQGGTQKILASFDEPSSVRYTHWSPALAATWRPMGGGWLLAASFVEAFRPPLLDEAFTQGAFSRCGYYNLGAAAPDSQICGALYRPEVAYNTQVSVAYAPLAPPLPGLSLNGRLTLFRSDVESTLESLRAVNGVVSQPGTEQRQGLELEASASYRWLYGSLSWAQVRGEVYDGQTTGDLYDVPGDTFVGQLGVRLLGGRLAAGWRYKQVGARTAVVGLAPGNRPILGTQPGYEVNDLYATYQLGTHLELRFAVENLFNETYYLNDGFGGGIGSQAPGRDLRGAISLRF
jgi:hemoglobin/transferrin/lactoferrin receptor protein